MDTMNDSVIICDAITPKTNNITNYKNKKNGSNNNELNTINNLNEELPKVKLRVPLRTVYESPLDPRMNNICNSNPSIVINLAAKRFRNDQDSKVHPSNKKRKIANLSETIVIESDDETETLVQSQGSEIILVDDTDQGISHTVSKITCKSNKKNRKKKKKINAVNSQYNGDDEEIAVVWSSTCSESNEIDSGTVNNNEIDNDMFFVDTTGDQDNLKKKCLIRQRASSIPKKKLQTVSRKYAQQISQSSGKFTDQNRSRLTSQTQLGKNERNKSKDKLREIIVDGCNVAFGYSHQKVFAKMGMKLVLDYFRKRGHTVKIFLPQNQRKRGREYLENWYRQGDVVFTPSRNVGGKHIVPYDDRFIVDYATKCEGIVITSDQYRDLWMEKPEWRETIEKRLLAPTFVGDYVMFPEDPLGRNGPKLDEFLKH